MRTDVSIKNICMKNIIDKQANKNLAITAIQKKSEKKLVNFCKSNHVLRNLINSHQIVFKFI